MFVKVYVSLKQYVKNIVYAYSVKIDWLYDTKCLKNVRTNNDFKTCSFDKWSILLDNGNQNNIMFTFSLHHATCITIYWLNQTVSFHSVNIYINMCLLTHTHTC